MSVAKKIDADLKTAMLTGDRVLATILRGLKSVILYEEVAKGVRNTGLDNDAVIVLLAKEAKKRQESVDLYNKGGDLERAAAEQKEKEIIEAYLPAQISDEELSKIVEEIIETTDATSMQQMGRVIGAVKTKVGVGADGARIAELVKKKLS